MANAMEIYQLLPKTNCKKCGKSSCMAFAAALLSREKNLDECTPMLEEEKYSENYTKLKGLVSPAEQASETGMIVHEDRCIGCGNCVVACPVNVAEDPKGAGSGNAPTNERVILKVEDGIVRLSNVEDCRRFGENKRLCSGCIVTCPTKAIEFV
ncbi:(Fe-S)-binding protein [Methanohalophilus portucalensis]|uniref:4Fe-4S dicluster domain-containing protein n=3 Tax=Methanohalophilus portucalensis TaxID=39664 RepID=A0A1X7MU75_9EURY|nr:(Fe-S)-binding protein [Methanohalophilus portucalensis]ATU08828.1 tRNA CCA-pyrophosphorylase [Methanohalophilus portucalensis]RNI11326.1 4Fe-4S dicluster domain-containing protein [Methanohalophilus portucalensis FDF-1]SMH27687.1 formylmethanofuran dehydrogenase, subunit G [Methanohalophilus portucalensis FDF-1]